MNSKAPATAKLLTSEATRSGARSLVTQNEFRPVPAVYIAKTSAASARVRRNNSPNGASTSINSAQIRSNEELGLLHSLGSTSVPGQPRARSANPDQTKKDKGRSESVCRRE